MCTTFVKRPVYKSQKQTFHKLLFKGLVSASHFQGKKKTDEDRLEVRKEIFSNGNLNMLAIKLTVYSRYLRRTSSSAPASSNHTGTSFSTIFKVNFYLLLTRLAGYFSMRLKKKFLE